MALGRISVEKLIQRQRIRRRGSSGAPRRRGHAVARAAKISAALVGLTLAGLLAGLAYRFIRSDYFELKKLVITGVSESVAREICALTKLAPNQRINLLLIRERTIRESVLKHPRIRSARVVKSYPNGLIIHAQERQPVAILPCGVLYLMDRDGYVLDTLAQLDRSQSHFPFITGIAADQVVLGQPVPTKAVCRALDLFECVREMNPALSKALSEIRIDHDEGLTLVLSGGVEIRFGTGEFAGPLAALDLFLRKYGNWEKLEYVDLRFEKQIVFRERDEQAASDGWNSVLYNVKSETLPATVRQWPASRARREL